MKISSSQAIELLKKNQVVAIPTETVYGLAARIGSDLALNKIFETKKRPFFDPLIVHVTSIDQAKTLCLSWNPIMQCLAESFWPGPLTLVVPKTKIVSDLITSGLTTVGLRCPQHPIALEIIEGVGQPLAAPSANLFGQTSPSQADHVISEFNNQVPVVDGGACSVGIESTVLLVQNLKISILRPGQITELMIEKALNQEHLEFQWTKSVDKKLSPGQMKHHYMPSKPLFGIDSDFKGDLISRLNKELSQLPDEVEGVKIHKPKQIRSVKELVLSDLAPEAARQLYSELRILAEGPEDSLIFHFNKSHDGPEWVAVRERLSKACTKYIKS